MVDQVRLPAGVTWVDIGEVMTNFDHTIDEGVARRLESEDRAVARYSGLNFNGKVWFEPGVGVYRCEVWRYGVYRMTVSGTLAEIMREVSERYGR